MEAMGRQTYLPIEILDYVETHARSEEEVFGISQRELAKSLGYHPCSMSRPLDQLVRDGLLVSGRGLVRGGHRKQLTYRITPAGAARLRRETRDVPLLARDVPPPPQPFLGRKTELEQLEAAPRGPGGAVTVVEGPPGMGKTALVAAHLRRGKRGRVPYWFTVRPSSSPREFLSGLAHALSFAGNPQLAYYAQLPRNPVAREVADLAARVLGRRPLLAVVDDYQLASPDLRRFFGEFASALRLRGPHEFYLVGQEVALAETIAEPVRRLVLKGLDRPAAHELTDRQGGLAERFEEVYQSTLGSPLLLKLAASNPGVEATPGSLPAGVVRQLPIEELRAVLVAALANEPVSLTFVAEAASISPARLHELVRTGLLHPTGGDRVEVLEVVRRAALDRMEPGDERDAHVALARFYGRSHRPEAIRERFLHLAGADDLLPAMRLLVEHQQVILRLGYSENLRRALRHLATGLPRGTPRVRVLMAEAALLRHHSEYAESIGTLRRAIADSPRTAPLAYEARLMIVEMLLRLGQVDEALAEFERARNPVPGSRRLTCFVRLTRARIEEARANGEKAFELYQETFDLSRAAHAQDLGLEAVAAWSRLAGITQGAEAALRVVDDALPQARLANRMDIVFNLLLVRARAYSETGRDDLAELEMRALRSEAESLGYLNQLTYTLSGLAAVAVGKSQWNEAGVYSRQAIQMAEQLGNDLVLGHTLAILCSSKLRQAAVSADPRLVEEARAHGERSVEVLGRLAPSESLMLAHSYLAEVWLSKSDLARARTHYETAIALGNRIRSSYILERLQAELGTKLAPTVP